MLLVLAVGCAARLVLGGLNAPNLSATLLGLLLGAGVAVTAWLVLAPRAGFVAALAAMLVLNVAALTPRAIAPYDERQALYRTDQDLSLPVPNGASSVQVLVEPVLTGPTPRFGLAGNLDNGPVVAWSCPWRPGMQRVELPLPTSGSTLRLRLTGSPSRDGDYLLVYTAVQGPTAAPDAVRCALAP
jgi:hypothetical protein